MSITNITERESALEAELAEQCRLNSMGAEREYVLLGKIEMLERERDALKALVINVHKAKGRYHSQLAMCDLYEACGLPFVKPVSGEKS